MSCVIIYFSIFENVTNQQRHCNMKTKVLIRISLLLTALLLSLLISCDKDGRVVQSGEENLTILRDYSRIRREQEVQFQSDLRSISIPDSQETTPSLFDKMGFDAMSYIMDENTIDWERLYLDFEQKGVDPSLLKRVADTFDSYISTLNEGNISSEEAMLSSIQAHETLFSSENSNSSLQVLSGVDVLLSHIEKQNGGELRVGGEYEDALADCKSDRDRAMKYLNTSIAFQALGAGCLAILSGVVGPAVAVTEATLLLGEYAIRQQEIEDDYRACVQRAERSHRIKTTLENAGR